MAADIISSDDVFLILGIESPTDLQMNAMEIIRRGVESGVRSECQWNITEETITCFLPEIHKPTAPTVGTMNLAPVYSPSAGMYYQSRTRNRLQLPSPFVKSVTSVFVDSGAIAGNGPSDFPVSSQLDPETDYYLEVENSVSGGVSFSKSGGLIRVGQPWPSTGGTVKVTFVSGFDADDLNDSFYELKNAIIIECALKWVARQRIANPGAAGTLKSEKLGDYSYTLSDSADDLKVALGGGISRQLIDFLNVDYKFLSVAV